MEIMVRITVLGSGSRGNAILVDGSEGSVLVDAGFSARTIAQRLLAVERQPESINALLLTHEHVDHASGATASCSRWGWPVVASQGTLAALADMASGAPAVTQALAANAPTQVAGFSVEHHAVPHDAADCRALVLTDTRSGARVGVVLDAGHVPDTLPAFLAHLDLLVIEANHDTTMLANGPYPRALKARIRGGSGHLSNTTSATLAADCAHRGLRGVLLAHLSETNNTPEIAVATARDILRRAGWHSDALWACPQRAPMTPVDLNGPSAAWHGIPRATQLALF
ncbi:MAG TPA: MBL fold metallo-hydrolase [Gemmatimonas aurantiaca]|uniref:MBL fold metallo-hydrolase n=1 Tax=Gemmatimonas aurantiaca TaxID=173480 RepID=A0A3D4V9I2_9BACT|nr:MBL fold metallo-hydrolase [Gemmatimonas aurantiaca]